MDYVASLTQEQKFQIYRTDEKSVAECVAKINEVMNPTEEELQVIEEQKKEASFKNFLSGLKGGNSSAEEEEAAE